MKIETKFNVGETVYFLSDNIINNGVIKEIIINVRGGILEMYEVKYLKLLLRRSNARYWRRFLFESAKDLVDKLMSDFENSQKENE